MLLSFWTGFTVVLCVLPSLTITLDEEERVSCFTLILFLFSCVCTCMSLSILGVSSHVALDWSAIVAFPCRTCLFV